MMKMLTASASVWYGRISPHVELISPSRSWISQIESPVTRLGTKSEPTRIASTSAFPESAGARARIPPARPPWT